jgi:hypothetical protein
MIRVIHILTLISISISDNVCRVFVTRRVPPAEQELLTPPAHLSSRLFLITPLITSTFSEDGIKLNALLGSFILKQYLR